MKSLRPKMWALLVLVLGGAGAFAATQGAPVEAADHLDPPNRVHSATPATDDRAADIADVFVWTRDPGGGMPQHTVFALSFDGPNAAGAHALTCDRDVLYQIHITADGGICPTMVDNGAGTMVACSAAAAGHPCGQFTPSTGGTGECAAAFNDMHTINVRFAQNGSAGCVVQAEFVGSDGATAIGTPVAGAVETNLTGGNTQLYAGLRDDAFFFDLAGFRATLMTGRLSFTGADFFAGQNTPVVVIEVPTSTITQSTHALHGATGNVIRVWASTSRYRPHT